MTSIRSRLALGSLWISAGRVAVNILGFVGLLLLARYLVPADFGLVAIASVILGILTSVTTIPLSAVLVRHENPTSSHLDTAWTLSLIRGALLASAMVGGGWLAAAVYGDQRLFPVMAALALTPLVDGLRNPRSILLARDLVFKQQVLIQMLEKVSAFIVSVAVAYFYQSYWALVVGWTAGSLAATATSYFVLPFRPKFSLECWREFFSFSIWFALSQIVSEITWRFDQLLVGRFLGQATLGLYRVGSDIAQMPTRELTVPLTATLFPAFANLRHDKVRLSLAYTRAQTIVSAIALPAGVGTALIAEPLILLLMTEQWTAAIPVIQALSAIFALQTLGSLATPLGMALGQVRLLFMRDLQMAFVRVPIVVAGMLLFGLVGVIGGRVISGLIAIPINLIVVRRLTGIPVWRQIAGTMRSLTSVALMAAGLVMLDQYWVDTSSTDNILLKLVISILCGAFIYLSSHLVLWFIVGKPDGPERESWSVWQSFLAARGLDPK